MFQTIALTFLENRFSVIDRRWLWSLLDKAVQVLFEASLRLDGLRLLRYATAGTDQS